MKPETWKCYLEGQTYVVRDAEDVPVVSSQSRREAVAIAILVARSLEEHVRIVDGGKRAVHA